jgi:hypothetical protein
MPVAATSSSAAPAAPSPASAVDQLGSTGDDTLTGSATAETLVGNAGNDTLIGNGGADVLYGGAGDDRFVLNASNIAALAAGVTAGQLARIDGGSGIDTITLAGSGLSPRPHHHRQPGRQHPRQPVAHRIDRTYRPHRQRQQHADAERL